MTVIAVGFGRDHVRGALGILLREVGETHCIALTEEPAPRIPGVLIERVPMRPAMCGVFPSTGAPLEPLGEALLQAMARTESVALKMLDELNQPPARLSYEQRLQIYHAQLRYWNDCLIRNDVRLFASVYYPHEICDFVLHELCRVKGIPAVMLGHTPILETASLHRDWRDLPIGLERRYAELLARREEAIHLPLYGPFEAYWNRQSVPSYFTAGLAIQRRVDSLGGFWAIYLRRLWLIAGGLKPARRIARLFAPDVWRKHLLRFFVKRRHHKVTRKIKTMYGRLVDLAPASGDPAFVFVPLHDQPEVTTSLLGGQFVHQELMIEILAAALPPGWELWIKEHPGVRSKGRNPRLYHALRRIPRVRFVPRDLPSSELIARCRAVATVTGTAGWEGLFQGKPAIVFGITPYQIVPGVFPVRDRAACVEALEHIRGGVRPTRDDVRVFVRALQDTTLVAHFNMPQDAVITPEQNAELFGQALVAAFRGEGLLPPG